ncbi:MAG TPA: pirin-like C-terminal cupin domain-containing protein [Chitinophagaceae bacterium]|nr:pirin-like C-terminal cupin domain-containing protein [Chitinophagaceae bacterium]
MLLQRTIERIDTPAAEPGFLGAGHSARPLINADFADSDPFILLMDDVLDKKDSAPVGGPHPHAGFETVSLLLEGELGDEAHRMQAGDFQLMTAGSGIIHTETIDKQARMRLLQLWVNLPKKDRWTTPRVQDLPLAHVPTLLRDGLQIRLYSGALEELVSPIKNHTPMIIADISMDAGTDTSLAIPGAYNGFLYVLEGSVLAGESLRLLEEEQVGWLNRPATSASTQLTVQAGTAGARFVLYAGQPTGDTILSHGPFIADKPEEIQALYKRFRHGGMQHINSVAPEQKIHW